MGNVESINLSLSNIWKTWYLFRKGKKRTLELDIFQYFLERNLYELFVDLNGGTYKHGAYRRFISIDNKKREISVASIRDRVVHRLLYEYLVGICDKTFIYDVWSCRSGKGLMGAIERTEEMLTRFSDSFVWRSDIKKFFDNVNKGVLTSILLRRVEDEKALRILKEIIGSYGVGLRLSSGDKREKEREREEYRSEI